MSERKPHKWAEVIKAWADGAEVQVRLIGAGIDWTDLKDPEFKDRNSEYRVKPTPQPLRVEDVPLGFPCRVMDGRIFMPLWIDEDGDMRGYCPDNLDFALFFNPSEIDPASIIPTQEVWLTICTKGYLSKKDLVGGGYTSKEKAESVADRTAEFVYGPIRIPLKPLA